MVCTRRNKTYPDCPLYLLSMYNQKTVCDVFHMVQVPGLNPLVNFRILEAASEAPVVAMNPIKRDRSLTSYGRVKYDEQFAWR